MDIYISTYIRLSIPVVLACVCIVRNHTIITLTEMANKKESCFYKKIRPCIVKYLTKHSQNERVQFNCEVEFFYGTGGFRDKFETDICDLLNAINKSGFFLGLLFIKYNYSILETYKLFDAEEQEKHKQFFHLYKNGALPWKNVGIVVTASHNPSEENGVKLVDADGKQIGQTYEHYLNELVNSHLFYLKKNRDCCINDIIDYIIDQIAYLSKKEASLDLYDDFEYARIAQIDDIIYYYNLHNAIKANICIGFDTRESGIFCNHVLMEALHCLNIKKCINNMCYTATPCMHFVIYYLNNRENNEISKVLENINGYTYHKKEDDLDYLNNFYLQKIDQARQLYYSDAGREFSKSDLPQEKGTTISTCCKASNIENILQSNIDLSAYQAETSKFHLRAYNSDRFCYDYFCLLFEELFHFLNKNFHNRLLNDAEQEEVIYVDCANGIAGLKLDNFNSLFQLLKKKIQKINCLKDTTGNLNAMCGADYVYRNTDLPVNFSVEKMTGKKCCSFDGDADRLVYFYVKENNEVPVDSNTIKNNSAEALGRQDNAIEMGHKKITSNAKKQVEVLDGAKIITLLLKFIAYFLSQINLEKTHSLADKEDIKKLDMSIIQTAYGNTACINYITHVKEQAEKKNEIFKYIDINIKYAKTGIKNLERLVRKSSVGIYFEPNGHGTIYTNIERVNEWAQQLHISDDICFIALKKYLLCFTPIDGDALIDFLLIELTLKFLNLTIPQWNSFYEALPCSFLNIKCKKADLQTFQNPAEHEKYLLKPSCLQKHIEEIVFQVDSKHGRCFVRPSGTEHLIRIYAEAKTAEKAQEIIDQVKLAVLRYINSS